MEKISVIVPVYNVERYIGKCLASLLDQDYKNYEIILINDASTDLSLSICKSYAKQSNKVKLINLKTNHGVSSVRNIALQHCSGQYVAFVDSDDYVSPNFLSLMCSTLKQKNVDIVCCNHFYCWENQKILELASQNKETFPLSRSEFLQIIFTLKLSKKMGVSFQGFMWNKLFRRDLLVNVFFEDRDAEDEFFLTKISPRVNTVYYIGQPLYFYNIRNNSLSHFKHFEIGHLKTRYQIYKDLRLTPEEKIGEAALYQRLLGVALSFFCNTDLDTDDLVILRQIYKTKNHWDSNLLYTGGSRLLILRIILFFLAHLNVKVTMKMVHFLSPIVKRYLKMLQTRRQKMLQKTLRH